jgi:hypothetical protein
VGEKSNLLEINKEEHTYENPMNIISARRMPKNV